MIMKTYMAKPGAVGGKWLHVDATDKVLGRLAVRIATVLLGKHRVTYTPHVATGDFVIVTNASKIRLTGRKLEQKEYQRYSLYPVRPHRDSEVVHGKAGAPVSGKTKHHCRGWIFSLPPRGQPIPVGVIAHSHHVADVIDAPGDIPSLRQSLSQ